MLGNRSEGGGARGKGKNEKAKSNCDRGRERVRGTGPSEGRKERMTERGRNWVRKVEYDVQNKGRRGSKKKKKQEPTRKGQKVMHQSCFHFVNLNVSNNVHVGRGLGYLTFMLKENLFGKTIHKSCKVS